MVAMSRFNNCKPGWNTCPVCGKKCMSSEDRMNGVLMESEDHCSNCYMYDGEFSYGNTEERFGFVYIMKSWSESERDISTRNQAVFDITGELRMIWKHPDWKSARKMELPVLADWLEDHEFLIQSKALRDCLSHNEKNPKDNMVCILREFK